MKTLKFTYWKDGDYYLGFLNDYPDYETQGMSKEELVGNLKDLLVDLEVSAGPAGCLQFELVSDPYSLPLGKVQFAEAFPDREIVVSLL